MHGGEKRAESVVCVCVCVCVLCCVLLCTRVCVRYVRVAYMLPVAIHTPYTTNTYVSLLSPLSSLLSPLSSLPVKVKDRNFGTRHHLSCVVHGGDGFAFVIQHHKNRTATMGRGGKDLG